MAISLRLDDRLAKQIAAAARARGISKSALIRNCLDQYFAGEETKPTAWELGKHLFSRHSSGRSDLSQRVEEILRERFRGRRAKKNRR